MPSKADKYKELEALPFEDALKRLESIVARMEDGKAPLAELLERFEEGGMLSSLCQKRLDELQQRIEILVKDSPQGPKWRKFDPEEQEAPGSSAPEEEDETPAVDEAPKKPRAKQSKEDCLF